MSVKIEIFGEDARHALRELRDFAGLAAPKVDISDAITEPVARNETKPLADEAAEAKAAVEASASEPETEPVEAPATEPKTEPVDEGDQRFLGAAGGDKSRRNSAEKSADDALEALGAKAGVSVDQVNVAIGKAGRAETERQLKALADSKAVTTDEPAISTGEERVGPEDDPATEAQDKADEKAEVEASRSPEKPLTVDDLRAAMSGYVKKHGMAAAQEDGPSIFASAVGKPPAGEEYWKLSLFADAGQPELRKAIAAWTKAAEADERANG